MKKYIRFGMPLLIAMCMLIPLLTNLVSAAGGTITIDDYSLGVSFSCQNTSDSSSCKVNASGFYAQATGTTSWGIKQAKTTTVTLSNNNGFDIIVQFDASDYQLNDSDAWLDPPAFTIEQTTYSNQTELSIAANSSATITISGSGKGNTSYVNFKISRIIKDETFVVTLGGSDNCSYTATDSDGNALADSASMIPGDSMSILVSNTASGYTCVGFADGNGKWLTGTATDNTATFRPTDTCTIYPILVQSTSLPSTAPFQIGDNFYYLWESAFSAATNGDTVILAESYSLPTALTTYAEPSNLTQTYAIGNTSGVEYLVPVGTTFLVPFDSTNTVYTTTPETLDPPASGTSMPTSTPYRTLTMAKGASITVNGTMSVPAKVVAGNTEASKSACRVYGDYGHVAMQEGSSITVNGTLSVFGYITGNGEVTANSGASVYESFQIADFRGGQATVSMNSSKNVFPFSQYYIQNIEVPLKLYSGAKETAYTALYMSDTILPTSITFISNSDAMFSLTSGYMVKQYDKEKDRLIVDINGDLSISSISIKIKFITVYNVNSGDFPLPITGNMTVNINSGTTSASQDLALLPGSEINIDSGATFHVASGCEIFVYDLDEWKGKTFVYSNADLKKLYWTPGQRYDRTAADLKDAQITVAGTLNATAGKIYTTSGGAAIVGKDGGKVILTAGSTDSTNQATQSGTSVTNVSIPVNSAWLKNAKNTSGFAADNDYTKTAGASNVTYVYSEEHGRWAANEHTVTDTVTHPTCTEQGYTTHTCACGYSYTDTPVAATGNHTYRTDCLCTMCDRAGIRYNSYYLDLQGQIYLTFTFTVEPGVDITDVYVHVTEEANKIDAQDSWYMPLSSVSKDDKGRYVISQGIAAGAMTGNVTVQFQIGSDPNATPLTFFDGTSETGTSVVKTVKDYLQTAITSAQSSDTLKALCQAAAQFGGYAQKFYQTHLDDVVSSILGDYSKMPTADDFKNFLTKTDGSIDGVAATGQQVNLDSAVFLRVYFNVADPSAITSIQAGLNMDGVTLDEVELKTDDSGRYYVDVENIPVACWNDEYIISINNGDYTVTTSVMAWARSCIYLSNDTDQRLMAAAMYTFAKAADEYFYS